MMQFIYETDGIGASVEIDYDGLDDVLDSFRQFLVVAGYSFDPGDELTQYDPESEVIVSSADWVKMHDDLDKLRAGANLRRWADWTDEEREAARELWQSTMYPDSFELLVNLAIETAARHGEDV